ncbi:uncharacterized protein LOC127150455 isoform X2 [Cucumis melo]|uniref:Uncharacterized protein LOC127150455 isoform X2 n=1 Tax=Cucumis melo TaxID=3656 RepID=A0ABM3L2C6_CUCME|nr:uncharacterized protein LOC127150455 isoform X2 [Cucumis melo]
MLGEFVDEYTVRMVDVFAMPQSGTGVSVEAVDHVFQTNMLDMLKQTGRNQIPEAALMARSYLPSKVSEIVAIWRKDLSKDILINIGKLHFLLNLELHKTDGILVAASHPLISCGVATGMGFLVFKSMISFIDGF